MTEAEIRAAFAENPALKEMIPDWQGIADALSVPVLQSIPVADMFDVLFASGDYATIKQAQMTGHPVAVAAFATLADARSLGSGMVNLSLPGTVALLDQLQDAQLLTTEGRAALISAATRVTPVDEYDVRRAAHNDDGSLAV